MPPLTPRLKTAFEQLYKLLYFAQQETMLSMDLLAPKVKAFNRNELQLSELFFWIKSCIRAFLSEVDGLGYAMRNAVVDAAEEAGLDIPKKKLAELAERRYDGQGDVITIESTRNLSTADSLKLGLRYFPGLFGAVAPVDFQDPGWRCLALLIDARNDFTHPKRVEHLMPLDAAAQLQPAIIWFSSTMAYVFEACAAKIEPGRREPTELSPTTPVSRPKLPPVPAVFDREFYEQVESSFTISMRYAQQMMSELGSDTLRAVRLVNEVLPEVIEARIEPARHLKLQFAMRNVLRTLFSEVEGTIGYIEYFLTLAARRGDITLGEQDLAGIREGELEDRLIACANLWSREFGHRRVIAKRGRDWELFCLARQWRNMATHPKTGLDILLLPSQLDRVLPAASWFNSELRPMLVFDPRRF